MQTQVIKPASEHLKDIDRKRRKETQERARKRAAQERLEYYGDLRDQVVGMVLAKTSFQNIEDQDGPCVSTLVKWEARETKQPRLGKMLAALRLAGYAIRHIKL